MLTTSCDVRVLSGFEDIPVSTWDALLERSDTNCVYLTREFLKTWWETLGEGELLLVLVERDGAAVALAPLFHEDSTVYFLGSGQADYLDMIGDVSDPAILRALLVTAAEAVPDLNGFELSFVPHTSTLGSRLEAVTQDLNWRCWEEWTEAAPMVDLTMGAHGDRRVLDKPKIVDAERRLRRDGSLEIVHCRTGADVCAQLTEFCHQHADRGTATGRPSAYRDQGRDQLFLHRWTEEAAGRGWLRFSRLDWNGEPIAYHHGTCYAGRYLYTAPTISDRHGKYSPGHVLLRQLMLAALDEGATIFDLGIGEQAYKYRYATAVGTVSGWRLEPRNQSQ